MTAGRRRGRAEESGRSQGGAGEPSGSVADAPAPPSAWDAITLLPNPLPGFALEAVDASLRFLGRRCRLPILVESSGAGLTDETAARLIALAVEHAVPLNLGLLTEFNLATPLVVATDEAPPLLAELRLSQLLHPAERERILPPLATLPLAGLILHLDLARATVRGRPPQVGAGLSAVEAVVRGVPVPVLVRDGAGIPRAAARALVERGVTGVITGGAEVFAQDVTPGLQPLQDAPHPFTHWGVPTLAAVRMLRSLGPPVVSAGGLRHGLDAAKAIALGADLVVQPLPTGSDASAAFAAFSRALRTAMYLCGARTLADLRQVPFVATGEPREWLEAAESLWRGDTGPAR